jgi:hypothetical protein
MQNVDVRITLTPPDFQCQAKFLVYVKLFFKAARGFLGCDHPPPEAQTKLSETNEHSIENFIVYNIGQGRVKNFSQLFYRVRP